MAFLENCKKMFKEANKKSLLGVLQIIDDVISVGAIVTYAILIIS
ncbi:hypothetical protein [Bartonella raoultii]|nr:hypothetical protein [Bartonella raoultii]